MPGAAPDARALADAVPADGGAPQRGADRDRPSVDAPTRPSTARDVPVASGRADEADGRSAAAPAQPAARAASDEPQAPRCTTAQLRRFIKSRPWVPMHELRRRFGIWGGDDEVSPMHVGERTLFIGLPAAEADMMAELLSGGDVGYELSLDPSSPIVVGVYPMRPVPRS